MYEDAKQTDSFFFNHYSSLAGFSDDLPLEPFSGIGHNAGP